jgi:hypothetical protein
MVAAMFGSGGGTEGGVEEQRCSTSSVKLGLGSWSTQKKLKI